mgnify:CR=1 FL=1
METKEKKFDGTLISGFVTIGMMVVLICVAFYLFLQSKTAGILREPVS